jgi:hypothetical protein
MNENSSSAQKIFLLIFSESKAINKFFFRIFFDLISAFNFQQTLSNCFKNRKEKKPKTRQPICFAFLNLSSR